jgi:hypothetical protein
MEHSKFEEEQRYLRVQKRVKTIKEFYKHVIVYVLVNLFLLSMKYFKLEAGETLFRFSNFTVAFYWGIGVIIHGVNVFGKNLFLGNDWEERKIKELMNRNRSNKWE